VSCNVSHRYVSYVIGVYITGVLFLWLPVAVPVMWVVVSVPGMCCLDHNVVSLWGWTYISFANNIAQPQHNAPQPSTYPTHALCHCCEPLLAGWKQVPFLDDNDATTMWYQHAAMLPCHSTTSPPASYQG
jgi:hypothetical protein